MWCLKRQSFRHASLVGFHNKLVYGELHMQAAGVIAGQRAALIGRVLPCLLALAEANGSSTVSTAPFKVQPLSGTYQC